MTILVILKLGKRMLTRNIIDSFQKNKNKIAIHINDNEYTYGELLEKTIHLSAKFASMQDLESVGIVRKNDIEFIYIYLAAIFSNLSPIIFDPGFKNDEFEKAILHKKPSIIFASKECGIDFDKISNVYFIDSIDELDSWKRDTKLDDNFQFRDKESNSENSVYCGFTSGTLSGLKCFIQKKSAWNRSFIESISTFGTDKIDSTIVTGSFSHSLHVYGLLDSLVRGNETYILSQFDSIQLKKCLLKAKNALLIIVPTMTRRFIAKMDDLQEKQVFPDISLILTASSKIDSKTEIGLEKFFPNASMYEYYGASELGYVSYRNIKDKNDQASLGIPFPGVKILIVSESGDILKDGEVGIIYSNSPYLMEGYFINNELQDSTESFNYNDKRWLSAGDVGYINEAGKLNIVCRKNEVIKSGEKNVFPQEIENILKNFAQVTECYVYGAKDDMWGQKVSAILLVNSQPNKSDLIAYCRRFLSDYKCPKDFMIAEELPLTTSGKVARSKMQELIENSSINLKSLN